MAGLCTVSDLRAGIAVAMSGIRRVRFGEFELDPASGELWRAGRRVRLQQHPFRVLEQLTARPGELVTREQLTAALWPATTYTDTDVGLNTAIRKLRAALDDDSDAPRYIETVPRRGYRLLVPVEMVCVPRPAGRWGLAQSTAAAAIAMLIVLGTTLAWRAWRLDDDGAGARTVAVLPFENLSNDPSQQYFVDGMTDALTTELVRYPSLRVISRTTMLHYRAPTRPLTQIARQLDADALIEGTVMRAGDRVRVTVQLVSAEDRHLWAQSYESELEDVLSLQRTISDAIARQVAGRLSPPRPGRRGDGPIHVEAYDQYLQGRYFQRKLTADSLDRAVRHFQQSIALDPRFAPAHAGLADTYASLANYGFEPANVMMPRARAAAERALELDEALAGAHSALGHIRALYDWDWQGAETALRRALELDPDDALTHARLGTVLLVTGRAEEALSEQRKAVGLEPFSAFIAGFLCRHHAFLGEFDEAMAACRHALELDALFWPASNFLGEAYRRSGRHEQWAQEWQRRAVARGDAELARRIADEYATGGGPGLVRFELERSLELCRAGDMAAVYCAATHAAAGDLDAAFASLDQAFSERSGYLVVLDVSPEFAPLRANPRYPAYRARLRLPPAG